MQSALQGLISLKNPQKWRFLAKKVSKFFAIRYANFFARQKQLQYLFLGYQEVVRMYHQKEGLQIAKYFDKIA